MTCKTELEEIKYILSRIAYEDFKKIPEIYSDSFNDKPWPQGWYEIPEFSINSTWIVRADNDIVAFLISFLRSDIPYISVVAVKSDCQKMGITSNFIKESYTYWLSEGHKELRIHVDHDKSKAKQLYEKLGFKAIEKREKDTYMSLDLKK